MRISPWIWPDECLMLVVNEIPTFLLHSFDEIDLDSEEIDADRMR